ncbi:MAG: alpha/beta fold hydrolase, partial [Hylemonella sp.]|nr:alpha/beta fold hydrolase [Hylemonella sp.]
MVSETSSSLSVGPDLALVQRVWLPPGLVHASVVIGGAMGAPQSYYAAFAAWLASQGYRVTTFDYRGHGASQPNTPGQRLRGFRADLFDWARDYEAIVAAAKQAQPDRPLYLLGHSLGAQLPGLFEQPERIAGLLSIAAGSGYWRDNAPRLRRHVLFFWHVMVPLATGVCGYFPGRRLRMVGDLPAGVVRQWRRWCMHPSYGVGAEGTAVAQRYARARYPVQAWSIDDDEMMTERGTRALLGWYAGAHHQLVRLAPAEAQARRIGHFGLFRESFRHTLWPRVPQALEALAAAGVAHRTDGAGQVAH